MPIAVYASWVRHKKGNPVQPFWSYSRRLTGPIYMALAILCVGATGSLAMTGSTYLVGKSCGEA